MLWPHLVQAADPDVVNLTKYELGLRPLDFQTCHYEYGVLTYADCLQELAAIPPGDTYLTFILYRNAATAEVIA